MDLFRAKERRIQPGSQATPLSEDILQMIRGQLSEGAFGTGFGPLQQEAGTAARQFVSSGGGEQFDFSPLVGDLTDIFRRETDRGASQVRESFGALGGRFGTPLAREEGRFRREAGSDFNAMLGELFQGSFENRQNRLLSGIGMLGQMGSQFNAPAFGLAQQGILPEEVMLERPGWMSAIDTLGGLAGGIGALGGSGGLAGLFRGGGGGGGGGFNFAPGQAGAGVGV